MVHPEPRHLFLQLIGRIQRAPNGALGGVVGALPRDGARGALGLQFGVRVELAGVLAHVALHGLRVLFGLVIDGQGVNALLHRGRQLRLRVRVQLGLQIALRAHLLEAGKFGRGRAPGNAVDQRDVVLGGLGKGNGGQRQPQHGHDFQQRCSQSRHQANLSRATKRLTR
ncbi:hypothetical protein D3C72_1467310 [compost metagenome]